MESNEQTELTRKIGTDSYTESRMTASGRGNGVLGLKKRKRTNGHGQQYGHWCGEGGIRGLNVNGKKCNIRLNLKKEARSGIILDSY